MSVKFNILWGKRVRKQNIYINTYHPLLLLMRKLAHIIEMYNDTSCTNINFTYPQFVIYNGNILYRQQQFSKIEIIDDKLNCWIVSDGDTHVCKSHLTNYLGLHTWLLRLYYWVHPPGRPLASLCPQTFHCHRAPKRNQFIICLHKALHKRGPLLHLSGFLNLTMFKKSVKTHFLRFLLGYSALLLCSLTCLINHVKHPSRKWNTTTLNNTEGAR